MKNFWKKRRDDGSTLSSIGDSKFLNPVTLKGHDRQEVVFKYTSSNEGADDNEFPADNAAINQSVCNARCTDVNTTDRRKVVMKAYSCCSGSIFVVASLMDRLLNSCSDTLCVENNEDETDTTYYAKKKSRRSGSFH